MADNIATDFVEDMAVEMTGNLALDIFAVDDYFIQDGTIYFSKKILFDREIEF